MSQHSTEGRRAAGVYAALVSTLLTVAAWARGEQPIDDRGSESAEKAFMIILAIALGAAVSAAAVAFLATQTALFRK